MLPLVFVELRIDCAEVLYSFAALPPIVFFLNSVKVAELIISTAVVPVLIPLMVLKLITDPPLIA